MQNSCTAKLIESLITQAHHSPRKRAHHELHHLGPTDPVQRFLNVLFPQSYIRPHRHPQPGRWEWFQAVRGSVVVLQFSFAGKVLCRQEISPQGPVFGCEVPEGSWHTVAALQPGSVVLEMKPGPWDAKTDKEFAWWAPAEGDTHCARFTEWYLTANKDDMPPVLKE